jgi:hypothetical protein
MAARQLFPEPCRPNLFVPPDEPVPDRREPLGPLDIPPGLRGLALRRHKCGRGKYGTRSKPSDRKLRRALPRSDGQKPVWREGRRDPITRQGRDHTTRAADRDTWRRLFVLTRLSSAVTSTARTRSGKNKSIAGSEPSNFRSAPKSGRTRMKPSASLRSKAASRSPGDILLSLSSTARTVHSAKKEGKSSLRSAGRRGAAAAFSKSGLLTAMTWEYLMGKGSRRKCR